MNCLPLYNKSHIIFYNKITKEQLIHIDQHILFSVGPD